MYHGRNSRKALPESDEKQVRALLLLDDDWADIRPADRGRAKPPEDTGLDLADDVMTIL